MTDRYNAVVVVFEQDMRSDDAESTIAAIRHIKGVIAVKPNVADMSDFIAQSRADLDMRKRIFAALERKP